MNSYWILWWEKMTNYLDSKHIRFYRQSAFIQNLTNFATERFYFSFSQYFRVEFRYSQDERRCKLSYKRKLPIHLFSWILFQIEFYQMLLIFQFMNFTITIFLNSNFPTEKFKRSDRFFPYDYCAQFWTSVV
jgi:hypothetical protein